MVSFSGGADSSVLLHLCRTIYPEIKGVFCDTGLEYPEVKEHIKSLANIEIIRPKLTFKQVLDKYGWVYPTKELAAAIHYAREGKEWAINKLAGKTSRGENDKYRQSVNKQYQFLVDSKFKIDDKCCYAMKKYPFQKYQREHDNCGIILGTMAEESALRRQSWVKNGCINLKKNKCMPLSFWTKKDIMHYIQEYDVKIPTVYGSIVDGKFTGVDRTGCIFCTIGCNREKEPNRFQRLKQSHPKLYAYCMEKLELAEFLDFVGVKKE